MQFWKIAKLSILKSRFIKITGLTSLGLLSYYLYSRKTYMTGVT